MDKKTKEKLKKIEKKKFNAVLKKILSKPPPKPKK